MRMLSGTRRTAIVILICHTIGVVLVMYLVFSTILSVSYQNIERGVSLDQMGRAQNALLREMEFLDTSANDYAHWNDTYEYVIEGNEAYEIENMQWSVFESLRLDMFIVTDLECNIVGARAIDLDTGIESEVPPEFLSILTPSSPLTSHRDPDDECFGLVMLEDRPLMVASQPILTSEYEGPVRGSLIFARYLDQVEVDRLSNTTSLSIDVRDIADPILPQELGDETWSIMNDGGVGVKVLGEDSIAAYCAVVDVYGNEILLMEVESTRPVYAQWMASRNVLVVIVVMVGISFSVLTYGFLEKFIISRYKRLSRDVEGIGKGGDFGKRVEVTGGDEISGLGDSINAMLDELEESQNRLRASESKYRAVVEDKTEMICRFKPDGTVGFANSAFMRYFGLDPDSIIGQPFRPDMVRDDLNALLDRLATITESNPVIETEFKVSRGTLDVHWNHWTFRGIYEGGRLTEVQAVGSDITQKKRMEDELQKTQKLESLGYLAGGIAHDFNNVLASIVSNLEIIGDRTEHDQIVTEKLSSIEKVAMDARRLTEQLLTFSSGGKPIKRILVPQELVGETTEFALAGSKVASEYSFDEKAGNILGDRGQISQVVNNIVMNAIQAMPDGGRIRVETSSYLVDEYSSIPMDPGEYVRISIADEGEGISDEIMPKIFDPFFTTKRNGTGLGLTTAQSIVRNHGGYICVESKVGEGTTFSIFLPSIEGEPEIEDSKVCVDHRGSGRVLLMDDDEAILETIKVLLEMMGYEVDTAREGSEAVEAVTEANLRGESYAFIVMDLTIRGGMGGKDTIAKILEVDPSVTAIVSSGYSNDPVMSEFEKYGFRGVLPKPYTRASLVDAINRAKEANHVGTGCA